MENKAYQNHFLAFIGIGFMSSLLIKTLDLFILELKILLATSALGFATSYDCILDTFEPE